MRRSHVYAAFPVALAWREREVSGSSCAAGITRRRVPPQRQQRQPFSWCMFEAFHYLRSAERQSCRYSRKDGVPHPFFSRQLLPPKPTSVRSSDALGSTDEQL
ncbi:hypothetical protein cyc_05620 [Cyclospora cayetanensis]|uniref:Uncharacterized protein n=1 Tax=Cyclospora cayetanensis TaxID=88456 RepID=A0A1D3D1J7_9EIME|nr:hypothetical protein cyc_05620 [Cyclospora cayetanensis]